MLLGKKGGDENTQRVKVCFRCKAFIRINETDPRNLASLNLFDHQHSGHPVQTVNISELDSSYSETIG